VLRLALVLINGKRNSDSRAKTFSSARNPMPLRKPNMNAGVISPTRVQLERASFNSGVHWDSPLNGSWSNRVFVDWLFPFIFAFDQCDLKAAFRPLCNSFFGPSWRASPECLQYYAMHNSILDAAPTILFSEKHKTDTRFSLRVCSASSHT
jgi:hypothetical protein